MTTLFPPSVRWLHAGSILSAGVRQAATGARGKSGVAARVASRSGHGSARVCAARGWARRRPAKKQCESNTVCSSVRP
eukprot:8899195-Lingulodinium_polyedra.AAC.1